MEKNTAKEPQGIPLIKAEVKKPDPQRLFNHQYKLVTPNSERIYSLEKEAIQAYRRELKKALDTIESLHEEDELLEEPISIELYIRTVNPQSREKSNWIVYHSLEIESDTFEDEEDQEGSAFDNLVDHLLSGAEDDLESNDIDLPVDEDEVSADQNFKTQFRVKGDGMELITTDEREARLWYKKEIRVLEEKEEASELELTEDFSVELHTRLLNLSTGKATAWEIDSSQTFFAGSNDEDADGDDDPNEE